MLVFRLLSTRKCSGNGGFFLPLSSPPTAGRGPEGRTQIVDECLLISEVDAWNIPIFIIRPVRHLADQIDHGGRTDFDGVPLLVLRLGEGDGVGGVLLAGPDGELLVLGVDEHLHIRRVVQLGGGLDVQLQHLAGDGGNGSGTGLDEVNDSKIAENSPLLRQMKVKWRKEVSRESQMRVISKSNGAIFHQKAGNPGASCP